MFFKKIGILPLSLLFTLTLTHAQSINQILSPCNRTFLYKGRTYSLDSSRNLDAEGLRFVFKNHAPSEELLNHYQQNYKLSVIPAYISTFGILTIIGTQIYANTMEAGRAQKNVRYIFSLSGLAIALGGYFYGQKRLGNQQATLEKAVEHYNLWANEKEKIQVNFSPTPEEKGGEVRTQVSF